MLGEEATSGIPRDSRYRPVAGIVYSTYSEYPMLAPSALRYNSW
jgi:hypothetical protein